MYDGLLMWRRLGNISSAGERLWFIIPQGLITRQANGQGKGKNMWFTSINLSVIYSYIKTWRPFCVAVSEKRLPFNLQYDTISSTCSSVQIMRINVWCSHEHSQHDDKATVSLICSKPDLFHKLKSDVWTLWEVYDERTKQKERKKDKTNKKRMNKRKKQ